MKKRDKIIIAFFFLVLGIALSIQFRSVQNNFLSGLIPSKRLEILKGELDALKTEREKKRAEYDELKERMDKITNSHASNNALIKDMSIQVEKLRTMVGLTDVVGSGVVIRIENDPNSDAKINVNNEFQYLLLVVNELNASGSEAISINGQRVISNTEIRSVNEKIMINSTAQSSPFVINSIGNAEVLYSALIQRFGVVNILRERGLIVTLEQNDSVNIPKYDGVLSWEYAKTIGE